MIGLSVLGTYVMRKLQTGFHIGTLLGLVFMMSQMCLILSAIFGSRADTISSDSADHDADVAFAVFTFFLFIVYLVFFFLLGCFKDEVVSSGTWPTKTVTWSSEMVLTLYDNISFFSLISRSCEIIYNWTSSFFCSGARIDCYSSSCSNWRRRYRTLDRLSLEFIYSSPLRIIEAYSMKEFLKDGSEGLSFYLGKASKMK